MEEKVYSIVCRCSGTNLKAYENLDYYRQIARRCNQKKSLFKIR